MHKKQGKYVKVLLAGIILAILSISLANLKLTDFLETELYQAGERDLLNIIFMNDNFLIYRYLNKSDMSILLPVFSFYIIGISLTNYEFLSKSGAYYCLLYSRTGNKKRAIKHMTKGGLGMIITYAVGYSLTCYLGAIAYFQNPVNTSQISLLVECILHVGVMILMLTILQRIILFTYIKGNSTLAFLVGLIMITLFLVIDMQMSGWNILLFVSNKFYLDSIVSLGVIKILWWGIENKFLYTQLPYDGGNKE